MTGIRFASIAVLAACGMVSAGLAVRAGAAASIACPGGFRIDARSPAGAEQWCARRAAGGRQVRHGDYRAWYPDGRLKIAGAFVEGQKSGRWTFWHGNGLPYARGQKKEEGEYRAGRESGRWTRWHSLGTEREEGEYREGVPVGRWRFWDELGQPEREGEYQAGQETGRWLRWNRQGLPCPPEEHGPAVAPSDERAGVSA
jgi:hypothetical protein